MNPSHANSETKKVCTLQPKPSQAMLKEQLSLRSSLRSNTVRCSSAALSSDYITRPVALVQHCSGRGAAQRSSRHAAGSREAEEHLSGMCVA